MEERKPRRILCLPVRAMRDELAAVMLTQILREHGCEARELTANDTAIEMAEMVRREAPDAVCISVMAPSALVHARNLYVKIHAHLPSLPVVIGFWGNTHSADLENAFSRWPNVTTTTSLTDAARTLAGETNTVSREEEPTRDARPVPYPTAASPAITSPAVTVS